MLMYSSKDVNHPQLFATPDSFINVLKAVLVNGYGAKSAAGWSLSLEDTVNHIALFRNSIGGSGRYWWVKNDGILHTTAGTPYNHNGACSIKGCSSYSDANTTAGDFPRAVSGSDLHLTSDYGIHPVWWSPGQTIGGGYIGAPQANVELPWIIFADSKTAIILLFPTQQNNATFSQCKYPNITYLGDVNLIANNAVLPKAITLGGIGTYFSDFGNPATQGFPSNIYIENPVQGGSLSMKGKLITKLGIGGNGVISGMTSGSNPDNYHYMPYPNPILGGVTLNDIYIAEDYSDPKYTGDACSDSRFLIFGKLRGIYGNLHGLLTNSGNNNAKLGDSGDTVSSNGRDYLIVGPIPTSGADQSMNQSLFIDMTGPW